MKILLKHANNANQTTYTPKLSELLLNADNDKLYAGAVFIFRVV